MSDYGQEGEDVRLTATQAFSNAPMHQRKFVQFLQEFAPDAKVQFLACGDAVITNADGRENCALIPAEWIKWLRREEIAKRLNIFKKAPETARDCAEWLQKNCSFLGFIPRPNFQSPAWQAEIQAAPDSKDLIIFVDSNPPNPPNPEKWEQVYIKAAQSLYAAREKYQSLLKSGG